MAVTFESYDRRINQINTALAKYDIKSLEEAKAICDERGIDVYNIIKTIGLAKNKTNNIINLAKKVVTEFNGIIPNTFDELVTLPGVGRKTANLIMGDVYKQPAIVADTHLIRITNLIGLVETKDPKKVELELKKIIAGEKSNDFCHRMVLHGRAVCIARRPQCDKCCIKDFCKTGSKK